MSKTNFTIRKPLKRSIMLKRNLSSILIIIAMLLMVIGFDYSHFDITSKRTLLLLGAVIVIVAACILIFLNERKDVNE